MFSLSVDHSCKAGTKGGAWHMEDWGGLIDPAGAFQPKPEQESGLKTLKQPSVLALNPKSLCSLAPFKMTRSKCLSHFGPYNGTMRDSKQVETEWGSCRSLPQTRASSAPLLTQWLRSIGTSTTFLDYSRVCCTWDIFHLNFRPLKVKGTFFGHDRTIWLEGLINTSLSPRAHFIKSHSKTEEF